MHRLVFRTRLLSSDHTLLWDKQVHAEHQFNVKEKKEYGGHMLRAICKSNCDMDSVYNDEWKDFITSMSNVSHNWQSKSTRVRLDDDLYLKVDQIDASCTHRLQVGFLAIEHDNQTLTTQLPAMTVQYHTKAGNDLILSAWCCDSRQHGKPQVGKLCATQTFMLQGVKCIVNPHKQLRKHLPVSELLCFDSHVSHFDLRRSVLQDHKALLRDLHARPATDVQVNITEHTLQCLTQNKNFGLLSVYFKM
tara:strand:- start:48571 stop:49314 length:744 start_codon:yes stop_codon:yes gene_type:complete